MSSSTPASCADGSASMPSRSAARATASASMRSDLPRSRPARRASLISFVATRTTRSPLASRNRSKEPDTCRQSSKRPDPLAAEAARPVQQREKPGIADLDRLLAAAPRRSPRRSPRRCVTACACPPRARSSAAVLLFSTDSWTLGGQGLLEGAATLLSSHAEPSRTGDERHCERKSGPPADSLKQRVSSPPARDHLLRVGHHRQPQSEQQAGAPLAAAPGALLLSTQLGSARSPLLARRLMGERSAQMTA